jgi:hypothetical protein
MPPSFNSPDDFDGFRVTRRDDEHLRFVAWAHEQLLAAETRLLSELVYAAENRVPLRALGAATGKSHEQIRRIILRRSWRPVTQVTPE